MKFFCSLLIFILATSFIHSQNTDSTRTTIIYGGKTYHIIKIGHHLWLQENLDIGEWIPSSQKQSNNNKIEKYYPDNKKENGEKYGGLYTWDEAMQYENKEKARGICPEGWHIPTLEEFDKLALSVKYNGNNLKSIGEGKGNGAGLDSSGFKIFLGSYSTSKGEFSKSGGYAYFWSSTEYGKHAAGYFYVNGNNNKIGMDSNYKDLGFCIRCVKDR